MALTPAQTDMIDLAVKEGRLPADEATVTRDLLNGVIDGTQAQARLDELRGGTDASP